MMFQKDLEYFPTLGEVRDDLIEAQLTLIRQKFKSIYRKNAHNFEIIMKSYAEKWKFLFELSELSRSNLNTPLTPKILSNPGHRVTRHVLYLYSMESFIYSDMNRAIRDQDKHGIEHYGAFAAALIYIIYNANK